MRRRRGSARRARRAPQSRDWIGLEDVSQPARGRPLRLQPRTSDAPTPVRHGEIVSAWTFVIVS